MSWMTTASVGFFIVGTY
uniref:Uncharacterized protein n=1 Tax=Rhizophora mucronata TaxID=61149 RepID=A0A2P2NFY8_RHIMU